MKNKAALFILFMLFASLSVLPACAVKSGNETIRNIDAETLQEIITVNKTKKNDISAYFGQPSLTQLNHDGTITWIYSFAETGHDGLAYVPIFGLFAEHKTEGKTLEIIFNQDNTVKSYAVSDMQYKGSIL